ncbi:MAG TPA: hypothetical protein VNA29_03710, partial [Sphingomicrobium sp.]|nr:hypothetical protein [Sphingomicrobium sp.]
MRLWGKIAAAIAAPLLLTGCLWGPGKFNSDLALRKGGTFTLNYRGEIMLQLPDDKAAPERWHDEMAVCFADGSAKVEGNIVSVSIEPPNRVARDVDGDKRRCTAAEVAKLKAEYQKKTADRLHEQRQEADNMAKLFGLPGADDESNRRFAANLMKYRGWRSVTYKGKGVFDVDYHFEGRTDQDFAFPMMPDSDLIIPFIMIRRRADGAVMVTAPALTGGH